MRRDSTDGHCVQKEPTCSPALTLRLALIAQHFRDAARQRDHIKQRKLRHLRAVDAARCGDDRTLWEGLEAAQRVDAGCQRGDPAQFWHGGQKLIRYMMSKRSEHLGV